MRGVGRGRGRGGASARAPTAPPPSQTSSDVAPAPRPPPLSKAGYEDEPGALIAAADAAAAAAPPRRAGGKPLTGRAARIFYASRTHSQLAQVVRELKRTAYTPKMAVLASRSHYCVNKKVLAAPVSVDEGCDAAVSAAACAPFRGAHRLAAPGVAPTVHDVEDLVAAGKRHGACPYHASRALAAAADLVLCPYSYLLDPAVRAALDIDADGAVVVIDEGHNVEDACREGGSASVGARALSDAGAALARAAAMGGSGAAVYAPLATAVNGIAAWLRATADGGSVRPSGYDAFEASWAGPAAASALTGAGLGPAAVKVLGELLNQARALEDGLDRGPGGFAPGDGPRGGSQDAATASRPGGAAHAALSRLLCALDLMHASAGASPPPFRLAVRKEVERERRPPPRRRGRGGDSPAAAGPAWTITLEVWALSPAPAFAAAAGRARCVIVASGTLAPTASFASELGAPFPVKLEAPHVVDMARQVWAGTCAAGLDGAALTATFKGSASFAFQDGVGACLEAALGATPGGVLAFFPSYALLDRLVARWRSTGAWERLHGIAPAVAEPRGSGPGFDAALAEYYDGVKSHGRALFLAVCRGKASEGLDFADARARLVLVFGVPFPAAQDARVLAKKAYNDARSGAVARGAATGAGGARDAPPTPPLSGDAWYTQQAFRALNQAVGRCIRHRGDWGGIVLVDSRFREARLRASLPRWVRGALVDRPDFRAVLQDLKPFYERLLAEPPAAAAPPPEPDAADEAAARPPPRLERSDLAAAGQPTLASLWAGKRVPRRKPFVPPPPAAKKGKTEGEREDEWVAPAAEPLPAEPAAEPKPSPSPPAAAVDTQTVGRGVEGVVPTAPPPRPPPLSAPSSSLPPLSAPARTPSGYFAGDGEDGWWDDALAAGGGGGGSGAPPVDGDAENAAPCTQLALTEPKARGGAPSLAAARAAADAVPTPGSGASSGRWR